jgi:hypothetical protein
LATTQQDIGFVSVFVSPGKKTIRVEVELSLMRANTRIRRDIKSFILKTTPAQMIVINHKNIRSSS